jgi:NTE family protein
LETAGPLRFLGFNNLRHVMFPLLLNKLISRLRSLGRGARGRPARSPRGEFSAPGKRINLALQGGGAHGAFTWGVLDQILEDGRLSIAGLSGTSAGAMNAVVLADGLARGGPDEARARLAEFWRAASFGGNLPELQRGVVERLFSFMPQHGAPWIGALSRYLSPYDLNPLNINPLKDLIERFVDFEAIRAGERELFVSATNVLTGELRVFARAEITPQAVMASACLPLLFRAVEIEGEPYWDGGYSGNPAILPFLPPADAADVLVVQINPRVRHQAPTSTRDIMTRVNEITFNAPLLAELRAMKLLGDRRLRLHRIVMNDLRGPFDARSPLNTDFEFFEMLKKLGQRATRRFLDAHLDDIGRRSTIDRRVESHAELV